MSSTDTEPRPFLLLAPLSRLEVHKKLGGDTADQRDVLYHMALCSTIMQVGACPLMTGWASFDWWWGISPPINVSSFISSSLGFTFYYTPTLLCSLSFINIVCLYYLLFTIIFIFIIRLILYQPTSFLTVILRISCPIWPGKGRWVWVTVWCLAARWG